MAVLRKDDRKEQIFSTLAYGILSLLMTFVNKVLFSRYSFDFTLFLMLLQMAVSLVILEALRWIGLVSVVPYTLDRGKETLGASLFYCVHSVFSLSALAAMNIPMYGTIKRCVPLVNLYFSVAILKKGIPSRGLIFAVFLITGGAILAGFTDFNFNWWAYTCAAISIVSQALYLTLLERLGSTQQYSTLDLLYINSFNGVLILLVFDLCNDQMSDVFTYFLTSPGPDFFLVFAGVIATGVLLNFSQFWCTTENSALTTSVVGNAKATIQTGIGYWLGVAYFQDTVLSLWNFMGILINMAGCFLYSYIKVRTKSANPAASLPSSIAIKPTKADLE